MTIQLGAGAVGTAAERARELLVFCDGLEEAEMMPTYVARGRDVARELLKALADLDAERSAREQIQAQRDEAVRILGKRADDAAAMYARAYSLGLLRAPDLQEAS